MDTNPSPAPTPAPAGPAKNTAMGILAYIGPLVIVSYLAAKDDAFVKFHVKQGLLLFIAEVAVWFISSPLWRLGLLWNIINLVILVFAIIGIINVVQGKEKELPGIGQFSKHFPI